MLNSLKSGNRLRVDFSKVPKKIDVPNLLQLQQKSYEHFLNVDNLKAISGPTVGTNLSADVITSDFAT